MQAQRLSHWCGPASVANALECLDIKVDQEAIAKECHVVSGGTDETEVMRALLAFGATVDPWNSRYRRKSMDWLQAHLVNHGPAILCVDNNAHWVTVIGTLTQSFFWLFDPAAGAGLTMLSYGELCSRWRTRGKPGYFGIGVGL